MKMSKIKIVVSLDNMYVLDIDSNELENDETIKHLFINQLLSNIDDIQVIIEEHIDSLN